MSRFFNLLSRFLLATCPNTFYNFSIVSRLECFEIEIVVFFPCQMKEWLSPYINRNRTNKTERKTKINMGRLREKWPERNGSEELETEGAT